MTKGRNKIDNNSDNTPITTTITTTWADADLCSRCNKRSAKKEGSKEANKTHQLRMFGLGNKTEKKEAYCIMLTRRRLCTIVCYSIDCINCLGLEGRPNPISVEASSFVRKPKCEPTNLHGVNMLRSNDFDKKLPLIYRHGNTQLKLFYLMGALCRIPI